MTDTAIVSAPVRGRWLHCPGCQAYLYHKRLQRNLEVCPECEYHFRLSAGRRLEILLDEGSLQRDEIEVDHVDPLGFVDSKPYTQRLEEATRKTGAREAATYGKGAIGGQPVMVVVMDFAFMGGSMGSIVGETVARAAEDALATRTPLLLITASGGARMQEGAISLMQMAKTSQAIARLHEAGVLVVCLLTDPTFGGVTASFAMLGDVMLAEPGALIGFAGPNVIRQTIGQELPQGFQTAEFLLEHGVLDGVVRRAEIRDELATVLRHHAGAEGDLRPPSRVEVATDPGDLPDVPAAAVVSAGREVGRPTTLDYAHRVFEDFSELRGDRLYEDNRSVVGGTGTLAGRTIMLIGHQKGRNTSEAIHHNFGMPGPEGYRKAMRLLEHAVKFRMPVVTLIDTPGAYPGLMAEERGQAHAIATSIMAFSRAPVPIVTVVTGEGGSGGALGIGVADRVLMLEHSFYSVISPEGCATILWRSAEAAPRAAEALRLTPRDLLRLGVVDGVVAEPEGGAHTDHADAAARVRSALLSSLSDLLLIHSDRLLKARYERFRTFGTPNLQTRLKDSA